MKLITNPFKGDIKKLREFLKNVDWSFELIHPDDHGK
jgi:predicted nucleotide-binding protein